RLEPPPAATREPVDAAFPAARNRPAALEQACSFEAVEGGIDRSLGQVERAAAAALQLLDDRVAVGGLDRDGREDQRIEMSLERLSHRRQILYLVMLSIKLAYDERGGRGELIVVARLEHDLDVRSVGAEGRIRPDEEPRKPLAGLDQDLDDLAL